MFARFTNEFAEGGDIANLTESQHNNLFLASTNNMNEGGLGQMWVGKRHQPNEMLHKFNATFKSKINGTRAFIKTHLLSHEDYVNLQKTVWAKTGKIKKDLKWRQIEADAAKVALACQNCQATLKKKQKKKAEVKDTSQHLVLDEEEINKLTIAQLDKQLDFHCDNKNSLVPALHLIPARKTIGDKIKQCQMLKDAVGQYLERLESAESMDVEEEEAWAGISLDSSN
jgi:hypothetical protein